MTQKQHTQPKAMTTRFLVEKAILQKITTEELKNLKRLINEILKERK